MSLGVSSQSPRAHFTNSCHKNGSFFAHETSKPGIVRDCQGCGTLEELRAESFPDSCPSFAWVLLLDFYLHEQHIDPSMLRKDK